MSAFLKFGTDLLLDFPVRRQSLDDLAARLEESGKSILRRCAALPATPFNHKLLSHIIGIERWGQRRLQTALGAELILDEYDGYRPAPETSWQALQAEFEATRRDTLALAQNLSQVDSPDLRIPHNAYGPMRLRAWLVYLDLHASIETWKFQR